MKENEFSAIGKVLTSICVAALAAVAALNIWRGEVQRPGFFGIALVGLLLFVVAKLSVVAQRRWISFGAAAMSPAMANIYRLGYWLMCVGTLAAYA